VTGERQDDVYAVLGVDRQATPAEIERAYRRAARATHPDARPEDPAAAAEEFKHVRSAYETLRDPARRAAYDRSHPLPRRVSHRVAPRVRTGGDARRLRVDPPLHGYAPAPWAGRVEIVSPPLAGRTRPTVEDDLLRLAALVTRLLRSPW